MPNYSTNLKTWGDAGSEYPDNYSYVEGEQPVDDWDNFVNSNLINDIEHLISVTNSAITVNANDGLDGGGSVELTESLSLSVDVSDFSGAGIQDDGSNNLQLTNDSVTYLSGDGLTGGGTVALGGSATLDVSVSDFAGSGLEDDTNNNLQLVNSSVTYTAGDGLKGGGQVSLGGSTTINIEPADFAGAALVDDGSDNLAHADTSTQGNVSAGAGAAITDVNVDGYGHVTSLATTDFDSRYDNYTSWTFEEGDGESVNIGSGQRAIVSGGGGINTEVVSTSPAEISVRHNNTSSQGDVSTGGSTVIDDILVDGYGHVNNMNTENRTLNDWVVPTDFDVSSASRMRLPVVNSDPAAGAGDIWYRSDLD